MFAKPNGGRSVPDPVRGDFLPPDGRNVEPNQYWYRRQLDGDITLTEAVTQDSPDAAEQNPTKIKGAK